MPLNDSAMTRQCPPALRRTSQVGTAILLLLCLFTTLLILLTPTADFPLSLFSVVPTGKNRLTVAATPGSYTTIWKGKETGLAVVSLNKTEGYPPLPVVGSGTRGMWLGVNGPSVHVGPMRRFLSQGSRGLVASVCRAIVTDKQGSVRESKPGRNWDVHRRHRELTVCVLLSYRAHTWCTIPSPSWRAIWWSAEPPPHQSDDSLPHYLDIIPTYHLNASPPQHLAPTPPHNTSPRHLLNH